MSVTASRIKNATSKVAATTPITGSNQTFAGPTILPQNCSIDSLGCTIEYLITVNTLTMTAEWQYSDDGINFFPARGSNAAANVPFATGTGSLVTSQVALSAVGVLYGKRYARAVVKTAVAAAGGAGSEEVRISYSYRTTANGI